MPNQPKRASCLYRMCMYGLWLGIKGPMLWYSYVVWTYFDGMFPSISHNVNRSRIRRIKTPSGFIRPARCFQNSIVGPKINPEFDRQFICRFRSCHFNKRNIAEAMERKKYPYALQIEKKNVEIRMFNILYISIMHPLLFVLQFNLSLVTKSRLGWSLNSLLYPVKILQCKQTFHPFEDDLLDIYKIINKIFK